MRNLCLRDGRLSAVVMLLALFVSAVSARAHEIRPGLLEINETRPGWYEVTWKVPVFEGIPLEITPVFPESLVAVAPPSVQELAAARIEKTSYRDDTRSLIGGLITIDGLNATQIDVLIQVTLVDGAAHSAIARPKEPSWRVPEQSRGWSVAKSYWIMGMEHILSGIDHLLFVLALMLLIPDIRTLVKAITAFTVAHSMTLGLATLGIVNMPSGPTEAVIALSILFLAVEIVRSREGENSLTERAPWIVAFLFGLFHGLGFAGALTEIGLPENAIPVALFMFNAGVETGQLLFVLAVLALLWILRKMTVPLPASGWKLVTYGIGSLAAYWTIDRVGSFVWVWS
jgi:hydrogenase/urease accessory protein HupE